MPALLAAASSYDVAVFAGWQAGRHHSADSSGGITRRTLSAPGRC